MVAPDTALTNREPSKKTKTETTTSNATTLSLPQDPQQQAQQWAAYQQQQQWGGYNYGQVCQ